MQFHPRTSPQHSPYTPTSHMQRPRPQRTAGTASTLASRPAALRARGGHNPLPSASHLNISPPPCLSMRAANALAHSHPLARRPPRCSHRRRSAAAGSATPTAPLVAGAPPPRSRIITCRPSRRRPCHPCCRPRCPSRRRRRRRRPPLAQAPPPPAYASQTRAYTRRRARTPVSPHCM